MAYSVACAIKANAFWAIVTMDQFMETLPNTQ
jgi:hypothetical protein